MVLLVLWLLAVIGAIIVVKLAVKNHNAELEIGATIASIIAIVMSAVLFGANVSAYYNQIDALETIREYEDKQEILTEKSEALIQEFEVYLTEQYPDHEKEIFDKISPDEVLLYFAKYPELRASETISKHVDEVKALRSAVYDQRENIAHAEKEIRVRKRNPWILTWLLPTS